MIYKFRGISTITNTWVFGSLLQREDSFGTISLIEVQHKFPHEPEQVHVIAESVGMWTGLKDTEGNDIYAGDIVLTKKFWKYRYSENKRWKRFYGLVVFEVSQTTGEAGWDVEVKDQEDYDYEAYGPFDDCKVISNIHDAPHLLNPAQGAVINSMNNFDPNEQKAEGQEATNEQVAATEQEAQEKAMESEEEGGTEG